MGQILMLQPRTCLWKIASLSTMSYRAVLFNFSYKGREISSIIQLFCESFQARASEVYDEENFVDIDDYEEILLMKL